MQYNTITVQTLSLKTVKPFKLIYNKNKVE